MEAKAREKSEKIKGTAYSGAIHSGRCTGYGRYSIRNGMTYEGGFQDDLFHGKGQIVWPDGSRFNGTWNMGKLAESELVFADGLVYDAGFPGSGLSNEGKQWGYCDGVDRRFWIEILNDFGGKALLVASEIIPSIPTGTLDVGNGYYDKEKRKVFSYDGKFMRNVDNTEHFWIVSTCRKGWMEEVGRSPTTHL